MGEVTVIYGTGVERMVRRLIEDTGAMDECPPSAGKILQSVASIADGKKS